MTRITDLDLRLRWAPARMVVLTALVVVAALVAAGAALAGRPEPAGLPVPFAIDDVGSGSLLFETAKPGRYVAAPTVVTEIDMRVGGLVARVTVRQQFYNPTDGWLEGTYVFPLPENAAVDRMRLTVGTHEIEARIAERAAARKAYRKARREGRRAALIEQQRPNIFTNAVANIGPKEVVTVELRYHQTLRYDHGRFRLRFPMVVAPRYFPGPVTVARAGDKGWASRMDAVRDGAADARRITSPVRHPDTGLINPVTLRIRLDAGFRLAELYSPYHGIHVSDRGEGTATIVLDRGAAPADRDFELVWVPETSAAPVAGLFRETIGTDTYLLAMVLPPRGDGASDGAGDAAPPRDAVFVIDRSGSMAGRSIEQAKAALTLALDRLRPVDRFQIIRFSNAHDALFGGLRPVSPGTIGRAKAYVAATRAEGGTVMLPALRRALTGPRPRGRLRQVVFLTDGAVGNEVALLKEISRLLHGSRLFTVGIGSAPNGYFMRRAAAAGRGTFTYIGKLEETAARMDGLFRKLERPVLTDVMTRWSTADGGSNAVDSYPKLPPDLYHGEPLVLAARLPAGAGVEALELTARLGNRQWRHVLDLAGARQAEGIGAVWGRARISELMDSLREGADPASVRAGVIETALAHSLVSRYTSLVAVAREVVRPADTPLASATVEHNLPRGWDYDKVFGDRLRKHAPARMKDAMLRPAPGAATPVTLPQGATPAPLDIAIGLLALLGALGLLLWRRRSI